VGEDLGEAPGFSHRIKIRLSEIIAVDALAERRAVDREDMALRGTQPGESDRGISASGSTGPSASRGAENEREKRTAKRSRCMKERQTS